MEMKVFRKITDTLFIRKQKKILEKELIRLEEQYKLTRTFPDYGTAEDENVQEVEMIQENLGLQRNIKNVIKDTREALKKIEKGKYGTCARCNGSIEDGRLKAYPSASFCVTCANEKFKKNGKKK